MIWLPLWALLSIYILWLFYLGVMSLMRARDAGTLTRTAYFLGLPILYVGLLIDFLVNVLVLSFFLLEPPREWLVSARLSRHYRSRDSWRRSIAIWFAVNLLDVFDPSGKHIK